MAGMVHDTSSSGSVTPVVSAIGRGRGAFSLVELLVVVGIIAVLLGILIPVLGRVREQGYSALCMSNLRQMGIGMMAYAQNNDDRFPFSADWNGHHPEDWIWWETQGVPGLDVTGSPILKYLESHPVNILRCPSDDGSRWRQQSQTYGPYNYSYTFNMMFGSQMTTPVRLTAVVRPAEKILVVEEDQQSLDDGNWCPTQLGTPWENYLAVRHDRRRDPSQPDGLLRGSVLFADGHGELVPRDFVRMKEHYDPMAP
ncbi:MAG: prepilin-type N-terminal cleavage/methylation domain [Phycisphaerales bacterium]|nr:prepilin-type N-terminal cleavage/methylation domain [Phycisphaerales bacterium]